ncbi:alcohol dehydrogenase catalytic domain-containing protein [Sphingomonadaceae bacterium G21617-S1]|nr:alcohol dehydrogenase catalytic domain-containing protein [Sphingomonadaceae bacterium G21617-S1]
MTETDSTTRRTARAAVFEATETFVVRELPLPVPGSDDMLVEVLLCGVDGSELHMFRGELDWFNARMPIIFGDEIIGRVAAIGPAAAEVRDLRVGDLVTVEARWPCNLCHNCRSGQYYLCDNNPTGRGYGTISMNEAPGLWGGYASHVFVPKEVLVHRVPEGLALKTALVACSLLANSLSWTNQAELTQGKTLVIIGPGPQGLGCALIAAHQGAQVVVVGLEQDQERLAFAERLSPQVKSITIGKDEPTHSIAGRISEILGPVDAVIETAGAAPAKDLAFEVIRRTGRVIQVSIAFPSVQPVDWHKLQMKEIKIFNPISHPNTVKPALDLSLQLFNQGTDIGDFVSHIFPLDRADDAIRTASYQTEERPLKVALDLRL